MTRTYLDNQPPVTLTELKNHLLITGTDFDTVLGVDLLAAVAAVENHTGMIIWRSTCTVTAGYCRVVELPVHNVRSITSVSLDNVALSSSDYDFVDNAIFLKDVHLSFSRIDVVFVAGYTVTPTEIPDDIKIAILMQAASIFSYPDDPARQMPTASEKLLEPYRYPNV